MRVAWLARLAVVLPKTMGQRRAEGAWLLLALLKGVAEAALSASAAPSGSPEFAAGLGNSPLVRPSAVAGPIAWEQGESGRGGLSLPL